MMTLLLIRHGQSEANLNNLFAGHSDFPLTELGQKQAEITAEYIIDHYQVAAVYASDLQRAFDTAKATAERLGLRVNIHQGFREIYGGKWEAIPFDSLETEYAEHWTDWNNRFEKVICPEGESVVQLQQRVVAAAREIAEKHPGQTVVVGTHATPVRMMMSYCKDQGLGQVNGVPWVSNASVTVIEYDNGTFTLKAAGLDDHLKGTQSKFGD